MTAMSIGLSRTATDQPLFGKTALVTDASHGFGRAVALALSEAGAQVLVHSSRSPNGACDVVDEIREAGRRTEKICADLTTPEGRQMLAAKARSIIGGRLDVLVTTSCAATSDAAEGMTVDDFDRAIAVNVRAPFFLVQKLLPVMCKGSSVVLAHSPRGLQSSTKPANVAIAGALDALALQFAASLGSKGVRFNSLALCRDMKTDPVKATVKEMAAAVVFMASESARFMTAAAV